MPDWRVTFPTDGGTKSRIKYTQVLPHTLKFDICKYCKFDIWKYTQLLTQSSASTYTQWIFGYCEMGNYVPTIEYNGILFWKHEISNMIFKQ